MSDTVITHPGVAATHRSQQSASGGAWRWARASLFSSWWSTAVTLVPVYLVLHFGSAFILWAFVHAVWTVPYSGQGAPDASACQSARGIGAYWAVVVDKYRLILFGRYPFKEQWRPTICVALFVLLYLVSAIRRCWRKEPMAVWIAALALVGMLMWGGVFGLDFVPEDEWGGLPVTLILATFGIAGAFPLAILVALGRRSHTMPAVRMLCMLYIELIRGVPLVALLFMAGVMLPLVLPHGEKVGMLLRAEIAIILFAAAYLAEVVRGGLQALPKGQAEAAEALRLGYWQAMRLIILPQALRLVIPPLVNTFIGFFKDTSLVLIVGIFDLLMMGKVALSDPPWIGFSAEIYIALALIYIAFCFAMSKYSHNLERDLHHVRRCRRRVTDERCRTYARPSPPFD